MQRPALGIVGNILYVGYGSMSDCDLYHGWLVGVPIDNPASVTAWAAVASGSTAAQYGAWVALPVTAPIRSLPPVTLQHRRNWGGGEAVIRFQPGPILAAPPADYWAPINWFDLDTVTSIWAAPVPCWWMCRAQRHPASWLRWVKMATRICLIAATSAASPRRWRR